jgi:hypothetical protein
VGISFEDLPLEVRRRIEAESAVVGKARQRVTAWKDIPPSWKQHKQCGWAGTGECLYCGDEGTEHVETQTP